MKTAPFLSLTRTLLTMFLLAATGLAQEQAPSVVEHVRHLMSFLPVDSPTPADTIADQYRAAEGQTRATVLAVLAEYVRNGVHAPSGSREARQCEQACLEFGKLGWPDGVPILEEVMESEDRVRRGRAIRAIVKIEGTDSLGLAADVVGRKQKYTWWDRRHVYEALFPLAQSGGETSEVFRFLMGAVREDPAFPNVQFLDSNLAGMSARFRTSLEREEALKQAAKGPEADRMREYLEQALDELKALPAGQRTRLGVEGEP